jgi:hypothetical protein
MTGHDPYPPDVILSGYRPDLACPPPRPSELQLAVPPAADAIVLRALAPTPDARFASLEDFAQALRALGAEREPVVTRPRRRAFLEGLAGGILGTTLVVLVVALGTRLLPGSPPGEVPGSSAEISADPLRPIQRPSSNIPHQWIGPAVEVRGVALEITAVRSSPRAGRTEIGLRVVNRSRDVVSFLTRDDRPGLVRLVDQRGNHYERHLDIRSVSPPLWLVEPQQEATGSFTLRVPLDPQAEVLALDITEFSEGGRRFALRAARRPRP